MVVAYEDVQRDTLLVQITNTNGSMRPCRGPGKRGEQSGSENSNDGNDEQKLQQRKANVCLAISFWLEPALLRPCMYKCQLLIRPGGCGFAALTLTIAHLLYFLKSSFFFGRFHVRQQV